MSDAATLELLEALQRQISDVHAAVDDRQRRRSRTQKGRKLREVRGYAVADLPGPAPDEVTRARARRILRGYEAK